MVQIALRASVDEAIVPRDTMTPEEGRRAGLIRRACPPRDLTSSPRGIVRVVTMADLQPSARAASSAWASTDGTRQGERKRGSPHALAARGKCGSEEPDSHTETQTHAHPSERTCASHRSVTQRTAASDNVYVYVRRECVRPACGDRTPGSPFQRRVQAPYGFRHGPPRKAIPQLFSHSHSFAKATDERSSGHPPTGWRSPEIVARRRRGSAPRRACTSGAARPDATDRSASDPGRPVAPAMPHHKSAGDGRRRGRFNWSSPHRTRTNHRS
jgi:hypothetical protein